MSCQTRSVVGTATMAIRLGVQLVGQFNDAVRADSSRTRSLFGRLAMFVRALPPDLHLTEQLQANLTSWPRTWEAGEFSAARYQMVLLVRKLRLYREQWDRGAVAVRPGTPSPSSLPAAMMVNLAG